MRILKYALIVLFVSSCFPKTWEAKADDRLRIYALETKVSPIYKNRDYICSDVYTSWDIMGRTYHPHGNNITEIIGRKIDIKKYCVYPISVYKGSGDNLSFQADDYRSGLRRIIEDPKAVAVNLSMSGPFIIKGEFKLLNNLAKKGVKVIVSAGNEQTTLGKEGCEIYPACFKILIKNDNFIVVTADDVYSDEEMVANKVEFDHVVHSGNMRGYSILMSGTSQAAAEHTGNVFKKETVDVSIKLKSK